MIKREYYGSELEEEGLSILILDSILICNITAKNIMKSLLRWLTKMVEFWLGTYHEGIMRSDQPYAKSRPLNFFSCGQSKRSPGVLCNQRFMF